MVKRSFQGGGLSLSGVTSSCGVIIVSLLVAGCTNDNRETFYDLTGKFSVADTHVETKLVDFGMQEARAIMLEGWYRLDERWDGRETFVWGLGTRATIELTVTDPRPLNINFECRPVSLITPQGHTEVPTQTVTVVVNGLTAGTVQLEEGFNLYSVTIPGGSLLPGKNHLEFLYAFSPKEMGLLNPRIVPALTIAWERLWVNEARSLQPPRAFPEGENRLVIPAYTRVDYFLRMSTGSVFRLDKLEYWSTSEDEEAAVLEVSVGVDGSEEDTVLEVHASPSRQNIPVPLPTGAGNVLLRISFFVRPNDSDQGMSGMTMYSPTLVIPGLDKVREAKKPLPRVDYSAEAPAQEPNPHNVIIYLIDTLRADHLGMYGYGLNTSPHLDELSRDGITFSNARAQSSWTRASVASIFTGLYPRSHDVNDRQDKLSPRALTLPVLLQASGYQTAGIITNSNIAAPYGFDRGFDTYIRLGEQRTEEIHQLSDVLNEKAFSWLSDCDLDRPFFLYLHTTDPHAPYTPRSPFRERFITTRQYETLLSPRDINHTDMNRLRRTSSEDPIIQLTKEFKALYDGEIAFNDHQFGLLVQWLKDHDLYESTFFVVVSDHGEEFYEHQRWGHGKTLYNEQLAAPLIFKLPGQIGAGVMVDGIAQHKDLLPTLLEFLGLQIPQGVQERSLWPMILLGEDEVSNQAISHLDLDGRKMDSIQVDGRKLIQTLPSDLSYHSIKTFDLTDDPNETNDMVGIRPILTGYLRSLLRGALLKQPQLLTASDAVIGGELEDRLRALGYIR